MENGILFDPRDTKDPCQFLRLNLLCAASIGLSQGKLMEMLTPISKCSYINCTCSGGGSIFSLVRQIHSFYFHSSFCIKGTIIKI